MQGLFSKGDWLGIRARVSKWRKRKATEKKVLTKLVRRQAMSLEGIERVLFEAWKRSKTVEFLPDGTPYKVSCDGFVRCNVGTFVTGLNKPIILVSDFLNAAERRNTARHELIEWSRARRGERTQVSSERKSHNDAEKRTNPKLTESARKKGRPPLG